MLIFRFRIILCTSLLLAALLACSTKEPKEELTSEKVPEPERSYTKVKFVQVDSLMIDLAGQLSIYEYNPEIGKFLAGDIASSWRIPLMFSKLNKIGLAIIDQEGTVLHQFKRDGNGPEEYGSSSLERFFMSDSTFGILGRNGLFEYSLDGKLVKKYKELNTLEHNGSIDHKIAAMSKNGVLAIGWEALSDRQGKADDSLFQLSKPFRIYDLKKAVSGYEALESMELAKYGFPEHLVYAPNSNYTEKGFGGRRTTHGSMPMVVLNKSADEATVLYPQVPVLEQYSMETGQLLSRVDLKPEHFGGYVELGKSQGGNKDQRSLIWWLRGGAMANSKYLDLVQLGEYTLLRYNAALPPDIIKEVVGARLLSKYQRWPVVRREHYPFHYQLFKNGKKVVPDFLWPALEPHKGEPSFLSHFETSGKIIGGDGLDRIYVFIPNNGEEERDYELIRVFQLKLLE